MSALALNLLSGLIGALFGVGCSLYLYYLSSWRTAKERLIVRLVELKDFSGVSVSGDTKIDYVRRYMDSFSEIYGAFLTYRNLTLLCSRRKADRGWKKYAGTEKHDILGEIYIRPTSSEIVQNRVSELLKAIEYKK